MHPPTPAKPEGWIEKVRTDIVVQYQDIELFDFVVATVACNNREELLRIAKEAGRAARQAADGEREQDTEDT